MFTLANSANFSLILSVPAKESALLLTVFTIFTEAKTTEFTVDVLSVLVFVLETIHAHGLV